MKGLRRSALALLISALFFCTFFCSVAPRAYAGAAFYVDAGGSYVQMKNAASFFNGTTDSGTGYGMNIGLWTTFTNGDAPLEFQLGVDDRYSSVSPYSLNAVYPVVRLQASRIFFSFGYSPYVMGSTSGSSSASSSSSSLQHVSGASALMGEAGLLLPVTPLFSFGLSGTYEQVSEGGVKSPSPVISGNVFMRFYFGFGDGSSRKSNEFHGWRYPFGKEM